MDFFKGFFKHLRFLFFLKGFSTGFWTFSFLGFICWFDWNGPSSWPFLKNISLSLEMSPCRKCSALYEVEWGLIERKRVVYKLVYSSALFLGFLFCFYFGRRLLPFYHSKTTKNKHDSPGSPAQAAWVLVFGRLRIVKRLIMMKLCRSFSGRMRSERYRFT